MARDYKYRTERKSQRRRYGSDSDSSSGLWRWMLITALIIGFVVFLFYLGSSGKDASNLPAGSGTKPASETPAQKAASQKTQAPAEPETPEFKFYSILADQEVAVPEHEIDTRSREERLGQAKPAEYHLQAGSYRQLNDADQLRAKLALMGIESRIEKAKVNNVVVYRIKMGPFTRMSSVSTIRSRIKDMGIDTMLVEKVDKGKQE